MNKPTPDSVRQDALAAWEHMKAQAPSHMRFPDVERETFIAGYSYGWVEGRGGKTHD